jgi:hypothetical protein
MNWWKQYKKSMAMPVTSPQDPYDKSYIPRGYTQIDEVMTPETAKTEKEKHPEMSFLGAGSWGTAVDLGSGFAKKYTRNKVEAEIAELLMKNPGKYPTVTVDSVNQIQDGLWAITTEKVKKIPDRYAVLVNSLIHYLVDGFEKFYIGPQYNIYNIPPNSGEYYAVSKFSKEDRIKLFHMMADKVTLPEVEYFYDQIERLKSLKEIGLAWDVGEKNIGINSKNEVVLLDLGAERGN